MIINKQLLVVHANNNLVVTFDTNNIFWYILYVENMHTFQNSKLFYLCFHLFFSNNPLCKGNCFPGPPPSFTAHLVNISYVWRRETKTLWIFCFCAKCTSTNWRCMLSNSVPGEKSSSTTSCYMHHTSSREVFVQFD